MGLKDLFAGWTSRSGDKTLAKNIARLTNQNAQHEDRLRSAEILIELDTDEAYLGLLKRYDMTLEKGYMDRDEKVYVKELLVSRGKAVVESIRTFLKQSDNVNWPERILADVLGDDSEVITILLDVLESERDAGDMKGPKRAKLLSLLLKYPPDPRIGDMAASFLEDFDESVRFTAVELIDTQGDDRFVKELVEVMVGEEEESGRVRMRILETLVRHKWPVGRWRPRVAEWLPEGYAVKGKRIIEVG